MATVRELTLMDAAETDDQPHASPYMQSAATSTGLESLSISRRQFWGEPVETGD
jgi:hypothetical protein